MLAGVGETMAEAEPGRWAASLSGSTAARRTDRATALHTGQSRATLPPQRPEVEGSFHTRSVGRRFGRLLAAHSGALPWNARILDVGAGATPPYRSNLPAGSRFVDLDLDAGTVRGVAEALPFRDGAFNAVVSFAVLEHLRDPDLSIAEAARVLVPGGLLLLGTHGVYPYHPCPDDYFRWTQAGLRLTLSRHLEVEAVVPIGGLIHLGMCLAGFYVEHGAARRRGTRPLRHLARALDALGDRLDHLVPSTRQGRERLGAMSFGYFACARRARA